MWLMAYWYLYILLLVVAAGSISLPLLSLPVCFDFLPASKLPCIGQIAVFINQSEQHIFTAHRKMSTAVVMSRVLPL